MFFARFALNFPFRMVYPFLPVISRGLNMPLETTSLLLTVRSLAAISSPLYGLLADRRGRQPIMLGGLVALVIGAVLMGITPSFVLALAAFALLGLSKASYDPAMQAYIGDVVPYEGRGKIVGILELPWALAWLIGVPIAGFLIAWVGWHAPFWLAAGLGAISLVATWLSKIPAGGLYPGWPKVRFSRELRGATEPKDGRSSSLTPASHHLRATRPAITALLVTCLLMAASDNVFVVYGAWFETQFRLPVVTLGLVSVVISVAELVAEGSSAGLADRIGKRRAVLAGMVLNALTYLLLPQLARGLSSALLGIALMILTFEFSIVCLIPLVSELAPAARGTVMALNVAAISLGRMISSLTGPRLWTHGGLAANALVSAGIVLLAAVILWRGVREIRH